MLQGARGKEDIMHNYYRPTMETLFGDGFDMLNPLMDTVEGIATDYRNDIDYKYMSLAREFPKSDFAKGISESYRF